MDSLEELIHNDLQQYLLSVNEIDERQGLPQTVCQGLWATEELVSECASRVHNSLMRQSIEPGTKEAFLAYVACLHQLYLFGIAVQLKRLGYHMTQL